MGLIGAAGWLHQDGPVSDPAYQSLSPAALAAMLARRCLSEATQPHLRVAVDGADAARPGVLADAVADIVRAGGRPCARVSLADWLRPASLRLEHGRADPDSYRYGWFDLDALQREVLRPLGPGGSGSWLPTRWDPVTDRATRQRRQPAAPGTVLLVSGPMLLGAGLDFELTAHLHLSEAALHRRTPDDLQWSVSALVAHERDTAATPDWFVRADHAERLALRLE